MTVIVTDGDFRSGLAVCRSLTARGLDVVAVTRHEPCLASRSRLIRKAVVGPSPSTEPDSFAEFVAGLARAHRARLVIPITDQALIALDSRRALFDATTALAMAKHGALRRVIDKRANLDLAASLGVPVPREYRLTARDQVGEMIEHLGWPIVLKRPGDPADPEVPHFGFRVLFAHDRRELDSLLDRHCGHGQYPLFQECAKGKAVNVVCFAAQGRLLAAHQYQSIRTRSGSGVLRRVIPAEPDLAGHAERLLRALDWDGVAHVGFFVDRDAGRVWYMEVNGRFWASVQGSIDAGWDFPAWVWDYFVDGKAPSPPPLAVGSTTCWHFGDFLALVEFLRGGDNPSPGKSPSRAGAIKDWAGAFGPGIRSEIFRWRDPMPAIGEVRDYAQSVISRIGKRKGRFGWSRR